MEENQCYLSAETREKKRKKKTERLHLVAVALLPVYISGKPNEPKQWLSVCFFKYQKIKRQAEYCSVIYVIFMLIIQPVQTLACANIRRRQPGVFHRRHVVSHSQLAERGNFLRAVTAGEENERVPLCPTSCRSSIKLEQYCNESLLGKWYVCTATYVLQGTNLLLWLQTSSLSQTRSMR